MSRYTVVMLVFFAALVAMILAQSTTSILDFAP